MKIMQQVYLKRLTKQDITKSVAICSDSVSTFWDVSLTAPEEYIPIQICHEDNLSYFPQGITIHKGYGGEKDWRICGREWKSLYADDNPEEKDIMVVKKIGYRSFSVKVLNAGTDEYKFLSQFFVGNDNYVIIKSDASQTSTSLDPTQSIKHIEIITAAKTKPFILLAGISGTGKSRIVRELAFMSCPKYLQDKDGVTPGNYCMIEVKPNWHDSTELLGYYSNISKGYQFKKFVKFLVKAKMHPEVPFFVCLDEMNLAPVEQYFAEILSILETRKHPKTDEGVDMDRIKTEVIVESKYFKSYTYKDEAGALHDKLDMTDKDWYETFFNVTMMTDQERELINRHQYSRTLQQEGLSLPDNVIIIGTVNMDETTHQFSRKVIDRAMTIEMNGGRLSNMFGGSKRLEYLPEVEQQKWQAAFKQRYVSADEVLKLHPEAANEIKEKLPARLDDINKVLKGTPFEVSYRVLNELVIIVGVMLDYNTEGKDIDAIINEAVDRILLMKILPRVEGDNEMFTLSHAEQQKFGVKYANRLEWLLDLAPEIIVIEDDDHQQTAKEKIQEMIDRLESREFTRYWP